MRKGRGAPGAPPPRQSRLSKEDRQVWQHAASSVEPLRGGKGRVRQGLPHLPLDSHEERSHAVPPASVQRAANAQAAPAQPSRSPPPKPQPAALDRRKARRIATGAIAIDARIDLHGLRQDEAYRRLHVFLLAAHTSGLRTVLVITGKGRARAAPTAPQADAQPGVIRRNVPRWLAEPELGALVISFAPAHARHGGDGALYVHLRKRDRR